MLEFLLLVVGLTGLWIGANLAIKGAMNLAEHYKISHGVMGLTILALGTDLPELFIDIKAALERLSGVETSGLVIGETIGTCFSQIGIMLGIAGLMGGIVVLKRTLNREAGIMIASVALLWLLSFDGLLSQTDGLILIAFYVIYFLMILREEKLKERKLFPPEIHPAQDIMAITGGLMLLAYSSNITVDNGVALSAILGVPQTVVGVLILGFGTSLPELATTITAVRKKAGTMALGNLIGSNIFDILFTLGVGSAISGFLVDSQFHNIDIPLLIGLSVFVFILLYTKKSLHIWESITLIAITVGYYLAKAFIFF